MICEFCSKTSPRYQMQQFPGRSWESFQRNAISIANHCKLSCICEGFTLSTKLSLSQHWPLTQLQINKMKIYVPCVGLKLIPKQSSTTLWTWATEKRASSVQLPSINEQSKMPPGGLYFIATHSGNGYCIGLHWPVDKSTYPGKLCTSII